MGNKQVNPLRSTHTLDAVKSSIQHTNTKSSDASEVSYQEKYSITSKVLGAGSDSTVYEGLNKLTNKRVAMKVLKYNDPNRSTSSKLELKKRFERERDILSSLDNKGVIRLLDHYEDSEYLVLVLPYAEGGDLLDRLTELQLVDESEIRDMFIQLVKAVEYIHSRGIVHRDIKPENILLKSKLSLGQLAISDFAFATRCSDESLTDVLGTLRYVAPEIILRKPYGKAVDLWSLGVTLFVVFSGTFPFNHTDQKMLCRLIVSGAFSFNSSQSELWKYVSKEAKDLIRNLLVVDPEERYTIEDIMKHPWIANHVSQPNVSVDSFDSAMGLDALTIQLSDE